MSAHHSHFESQDNVQRWMFTNGTPCLYGYLVGSLDCDFGETEVLPLDSQQVIHFAEGYRQEPSCGMNQKETPETPRGSPERMESRVSRLPFASLSALIDFYPHFVSANGGKPELRCPCLWTGKANFEHVA